MAWYMCIIINITRGHCEWTFKSKLWRPSTKYKVPYGGRLIPSPLVVYMYTVKPSYCKSKNLVTSHYWTTSCHWTTCTSSYQQQQIHWMFRYISTLKLANSVTSWNYTLHTQTSVLIYSAVKDVHVNCMDSSAYISAKLFYVHNISPFPWLSTTGWFKWTIDTNL